MLLPKDCHLPYRAEEQLARAASRFPGAFIMIACMWCNNAFGPGDAEPASRRRQLNKLNRSRPARVQVRSRSFTSHCILHMPMSAYSNGRPRRVVEFNFPGYDRNTDTVCMRRAHKQDSFRPMSGSDLVLFLISHAKSASLTRAQRKRKESGYQTVSKLPRSRDSSRLVAGASPRSTSALS